MLNVADAAAVEACFKAIEGEEGTPSILVNNAGVTRDGLLMRMSAEDWQTVLDTDLTRRLPHLQGRHARHDEGAHADASSTSHR